MLQATKTVLFITTAVLQPGSFNVSNKVYLNGQGFNLK